MTGAYDLARAHAPLVHIHPAEPFAPLSAESFIGESSLVWRISDTRCDTLVPFGDVDSARLGVDSDDAYVHVDGSFQVSVDELTRPFTRTDQRVPLLPAEKGYALVHPSQSPGRVESSHELEASLDHAPMYYEVRDGGDATLICYWMFFGSSAPPYSYVKQQVLNVLDDVVDAVGSAIDRLIPGPRRPIIQPEMDARDLFELVAHKHAHQGDWEGVTLRLSKSDEIECVHFRAHHGGHTVPASALKTNERIAVYCARGSHACYESTSNEANSDGDELSADGPTWDPVAGSAGLVDAMTQPWYGFGGAWGDPGLDHPIHVDVKRKDLAGPLGPSRYKAVWPQPQ